MFATVSIVLPAGNFAQILSAIVQTIAIDVVSIDSLDNGAIGLPLKHQPMHILRRPTPIR